MTHVRAHNIWCDQADVRLGLERCQKLIGRVGPVLVFVSGLPGTPAEVLVDGGIRPVRLDAQEALLLRGFVGVAAELAADG